MLRPCALGLWLALALALAPPLFAAAFPSCRTASSCPACCASFNNEYYCCPGEGNSLDWNTKQCSKQTLCPTVQSDCSSCVAGGVTNFWCHSSSGATSGACYNIGGAACPDFYPNKIGYGDCPAPPDPCAGVNCGSYGSCSSGTCTCHSGYSGPACTVPPAPADIVNPTTWLGSYTVSGCDSTQCCCLSSATIVQSDSSNYSLFGPLVGRCGVRTFGGYTFPTPMTGYPAVTYTADMQERTLERDRAFAKSVRIIDTHMQSPQCSAVLDKKREISDGTITVAFYSDEHCEQELSSQTQKLRECTAHTILGATRYVSGFCPIDRDEQYNVLGYDSSAGCSALGSTTFGVEGTGKYQCQPVSPGLYVRAACDGSAFRPYEPKVWLGSYSAVRSECDPSSCCCVTGLSFREESPPSSSPGLEMSGSLSGQCGGLTSTAFAIYMPQSDSTTVPISFSPQLTVTVVRSASGDLRYTDSRSSCSGSLTRTADGSGGGSGAAAASVSVAWFGDSACRTPTSTPVSVRSGMCTQRGDGAFRAACSSSGWSVQAFSNPACSGSAPSGSAAATGEGCHSLDGKTFVRVACDGEIDDALSAATKQYGHAAAVIGLQLALAALTVAAAANNMHA